MLNESTGEALKLVKRAGFAGGITGSGSAAFGMETDEAKFAFNLKKLIEYAPPSVAVYYAGDKVREVERLLGEKSGKAKLAFVGDGINDAPVLSRADIGIAMGAMGSDAAIEAADVVLMDDDPLKISKAIKISRKCIRIVYENIIFVLGVKFSCLLLVALGAADMGAAIFADVGVMVIAVLNAMRALRANA